MDNYYSSSKDEHFYNWILISQKLHQGSIRNTNFFITLYFDVWNNIYAGGNKVPQLLSVICKINKKLMGC